jgi:hypothetical protein
MITLSEDDRVRIRLEEQFRHEIRKRFETGGTFWKEKIGVPLFLVLVTALISGLLIPHILQQEEARRRTIELKSRLITEVVTERATAQMAIIRYNEALCDYGIVSLSMAVQFRNLVRHAAEPSRHDLATEREIVRADQKRENDLRAQVDREYADARAHLIVTTDRLKSLLQLYYGDVPALREYIAAVEQDSGSADELLNITHQNKIVRLFRDAKAALSSCSSNQDCDAATDRATDDIEKLRTDVPKFARWNAAAQALAVYIMDHPPSKTSAP